MRVLLFTHDACLAHDAGRRHPERPERIEAVVAGVESSGQEIVRREAPAASREQIEVVHEGSYVDMIHRACEGGGAILDPDTRVVPSSWEAALRSAGAGLAAIDDLQESDVDAAFVATRPPGHHALPGHAMGFCVFNNIAIAARTLADSGRRVAIVDWDVHHGNGTQEMFYHEPGVFYVSLHEAAFYPGTGHAQERGAGEGFGTTLNFPLPAGTGGDVYRWLVRWFVRPAVASFEPDWLLVSAGYDAHRNDPLAAMRLVASDYAAMANVLSGLVAPGRVVFFLEGGYDLTALADSSAATLRGLAGEAPAVPERDELGSGPGWRAAAQLTAKLGDERGQGGA